MENVRRCVGFVLICFAIIGTAWACSSSQAITPAKTQEPEVGYSFHPSKAKPVHIDKPTREEVLQLKVDELSKSIEELHRAVKDQQKEPD